MEPMRKFRSLKTLEVDQRIFSGPRVPTEVDEAGDEEEDGPANPRGSEPVVFLSLIEHNLQQAGPDDQRAKAEVVEGWDLRVLDVVRVVDEAVDHEQRE